MTQGLQTNAESVPHRADETRCFILDLVLHVFSIHINFLLKKCFLVFIVRPFIMYNGMQIEEL